MKRVALVGLGVWFLALVLTGCNAGTISDSQQEDKVKAMDDIAKQDPNYATKKARGAGRN